jgi:Rrf2 family protein
MSIIFSRQCEYALQAIFLLARESEGSKMSIRELTERLNIPYHFLAKILQDLTHKGFLKSRRGPTGGFSLARPASEITLYEIIAAIDGDGLLKDCVLGFGECDGANPCAFHDRWQSSRDDLHKLLTSEYLDRIMSHMKRPEYESRPK